MMNLILPSAPPAAKIAGQFYTPYSVAKSLVRWVVRRPNDMLLDPSCGEGAILAHHDRSRGIEQDPYAAWRAGDRNSNARIENTDFFLWAVETKERFDCAAGNPPFVRFQNFKGLSKAAALSICTANGVELSGLSSAWAAFLVGTASLLKLGGRMAFVIPAEIGHARYAVPVLDYLLNNFSKVQVVAVREKLFPRLSEDCWLLYCEGRGGTTNSIHFSTMERFQPSASPPVATEAADWLELKRNWRGRLRPLLLSNSARSAYLAAAQLPGSLRFRDFAKIGIGYISGDNDFFHLTPSQVEQHQIPAEFLIPTVRRGHFLTGEAIDRGTLECWKTADEAFYLLHLPPTRELPQAIWQYLNSERGLEARQRYKCGTRPFWFSVPGVKRPHYFLQYMSGSEVALARNDAEAVCTNSIHAVEITDWVKAKDAIRQWSSNQTKLSCELEGHPLGGGMLKLEPREAARLLFAPPSLPIELVQEAVDVMKSWRHIAS